LATACSVDSGPVETAVQQIDAGKAETVAANIRMGAGELRVEGGASNLMDANFRYSERMGHPNVSYDVAGDRGRLRVESPNNSSLTGKMVNHWELKMGSAVPLEIDLTLGAGEADLDLSRLQLKSVNVQMGAGEMRLNMAGNYRKDVPVQVHGGVGEARIRLPKDMGVVVKASGGIGSVNANGLTKRDGKYYNDAYSEDKPAIQMEVQGGVGEITLSVE
jgi:hypothetical protein